MDNINELKFEKGTIVTCENGHEVCEISRDIYIYSLVECNDFTNFNENITVPQIHDRIGDHPCHCGKDWIRYEVLSSTRGHVRVHIKDEGWK